MGLTVYITDDGRGIAPALAAHLRAAGSEAVVCTDVRPTPTLSFASPA